MITGQSLRKIYCFGKTESKITSLFIYNTHVKKDNHENTKYLVVLVISKTDKSAFKSMCFKNVCIQNLNTINQNTI